MIKKIYYKMINTAFPVIMMTHFARIGKTGTALFLFIRTTHL